jgi:hypothetical protein
VRAYLASLLNSALCKGLQLTWENGRSSGGRKWVAAFQLPPEELQEEIMFPSQDLGVADGGVNF